MSGYLPVPTMSRDWNVRPPMVSGSSRMVSTAVVIVSPSANEMNEFDRVSCIHRHTAQPRPPHALPVVLHSHRSRIGRDHCQELERCATRDVLPFPIDHNIHSLNLRTAGPG